MTTHFLSNHLDQKEVTEYFSRDERKKLSTQNSMSMKISLGSKKNSKYFRFEEGKPRDLLPTELP